MLDTSSTLDRHIDEFRAWCHGRGEAQDKATEVTAPLYHYTNLGAVQGILGNEEIWFTDIYHLNDPTEFKHGAGIVLKVIAGHPQRRDPVIDYFCKPLCENTEKRFKKIFSSHVASFTGLADNQGQWEDYGDQGRGCAIEFAPSFFRRGDAEPPAADGSRVHSMLMTPMIYDSLVVEQRLRETIYKALETLYALRTVLGITKREVGHRFMERFASLVALEILIEAYMAKNPDYVAEAEVRLTIPAQQHLLAPYIETRERNGKIVPYVRQKLPVRKNVTGIVLGPMVTPETAQAVRDLLLSSGLDPDKLIRRSTVQMER